MTISESIKTVFRKYARFSGRARRSEYWWFVLFQTVVCLALYLAIVGVLLSNRPAPGTRVGDGPVYTVMGLAGAYLLFSLATLLPGLAVTARRLHDRNRSGWLQLISVIPLIGPVVLIVLTAMDSEPGTNQYGPNPKHPEMGNGYNPYVGQVPQNGSLPGQAQPGPVPAPQDHRPL